jgi:uncharacterized protein YbjT (DUF2867 family)
VRIAVIGAGGLIGTRLVELLRSEGHDVAAASRSTGVDVLTGDGLADALAGADALVDVTNSPTFEAEAVMQFFTTAATNIAAAAKAAAVGHSVALSIVGVDGLPDSPYMRAKVVQERIIIDSGIPYTIVRATQFSEFTDAIIDSLTDGDVVRVPDALIQPIPAGEVVAAMAAAATSEPLNSIRNIGGPRTIAFEWVARDVLARRGDTTRSVAVDAQVRYFGAVLTERSLVTSD